MLTEPRGQSVVLGRFLVALRDCVSGDLEVPLSVLCRPLAVRLQDLASRNDRPSRVDRIVSPSPSHVDAESLTWRDPMLPPAEGGREDVSVERHVVAKPVAEVVPLADVSGDRRRSALTEAAMDHNMVDLPLDPVYKVDHLVGVFIGEQFQSELRLLDVVEGDSENVPPPPLQDDPPLSRAGDRNHGRPRGRVPVARGGERDRRDFLDGRVH